MEPARLRATLTRTPGLMSAHLFACVIDGQAPDGPVPADLLTRLLHSHLLARSRAWLENPDNGPVDPDLRWSLAIDRQVGVSLDADFPAGLARRGAPALAIVGSRQATAGMDTAREGALAASGHCIGVYATEPDRVYPACSAGLAGRIRAQGALISVLPPGALVVEATAGSGSLTAVDPARRLGKPAFAFPGSIRDPQARGCNQLIRDGATLAQQSGEILRDLCVKYNNQEVTRPATGRQKLGSGASALDNKYEMLLDAAGFEPVDIDVLAFRTGWSGHTVASMLLMLELQGRVAPQPGGRYCRLS
jgi:predicted Rossmann fold nucleotide-binding protein DprA/Smf involved in DNA uptake